jgi:hypothetical protein
MVVEWNESSRHLRVLRCSEWPGFDQMVSATVAHVRMRAREIGIADVVDKAFLKACENPAPSKRTVLSAAMAAAQQQPAMGRRA